MSLRRLTERKPIEEATKPKDRFEDVLLVGLDNERLKTSGAPSKAVGGLATTQKGEGDGSLHRVESLAEITMQAGYMDRHAKSTGVSTFFPASSFDNATGVHVNMKIGSFYKSGTELDEQKKSKVLREATKQLATLASDLFTTSMRKKLNWNKLADNVQDSIARNTSNEALCIKEFQQGGDLVKSSLVEVNTFVSFEEGGFNIKRDGDPRHASQMLSEHNDYSKDLVQGVIDSTHKFGTVSSKGTTLQVCLTTLAEEFVSKGESVEMDRAGESQSLM